jgi:hypothetical protein
MYTRTHDVLSHLSLNLIAGGADPYHRSAADLRLEEERRQGGSKGLQLQPIDVERLLMDADCDAAAYLNHIKVLHALNKRFGSLTNLAHAITMAVRKEQALFYIGSAKCRLFSNLPASATISFTPSDLDWIVQCGGAASVSNPCV